jgi:hypothetical protein
MLQAIPGEAENTASTQHTGMEVQHITYHGTKCRSHVVIIFLLSQAYVENSKNTLIIRITLMLLRNWLHVQGHNE